MRSVRFLIVAALALAAAAIPSTASAAVSVWPTNIAGDPYLLRGMVVAPDGSHHAIFEDNNYMTLGGYATDRGGTWRFQVLPAEPIALVLDSSGNPVVLGIDSMHHEVFRGDGTSDLARTEVPDGGSHGRNADIKATADGIVHVAWSDGISAYYATLDGSTWSSVTSLHPTGMPAVSRLALAIDADTTPHIIVSGASGVVCPAGGCVSDIAVTASPTAVDTTAAPGVIWAITGPSGHIDIATLDMGILHHATNATGSWVSETVASGIGTGQASIVASGGSVVLFLASMSVVERADWSAGAWHLTALSQTAPVSGYQGACGAIDAQGVAHYAFTGYGTNSLLSTYLMAPDTVGPVAGAPVVRPRAGGIVGSTVPMTVSWSGSDKLSGWSTSTVQQKVNTGSWATVGSGLTTMSVSRSLTPGTTKYTYQVRGIDKAGNVGGFTVGPAVSVAVSQQTTSLIKYAGTWYSTSSSSYLGGSAKYAKSTSASATIRFTGRGFGWVGAAGPTRGSAKIYVDGVLAKTISTYRSSNLYREVVWGIAWSSSGTHTIVIKPAGTSGHPRIDLDGIVIVK